MGLFNSSTYSNDQNSDLCLLVRVNFNKDISVLLDGTLGQFSNYYTCVSKGISKIIHLACFLENVSNVIIIIF